MMKLVVFAHTPPPHHGQSYMVKLMLEGFGGDARKRPAGSPPPEIACYHVNARFSQGLEDIGEFQGAKLWLIFRFCAQALWFRFRYGANNFYYVPAPGKRVALYRDWLIMFLCRPFFKNVILHWHAAGLAKWLETSTSIHARATTYRLFRPVDLSIVLSKYNFADAEKLLSRNIRVVDNGIADPCPEFAEKILPRRQARAAARAKLSAGEILLPEEISAAGGDPQTVKILYLAHCMREKGLFDALEGVVLANTELKKRRLPLRLHLEVAGEFANAAEKTEFEQRLAYLETAGIHCVTCLGFVGGKQKHRAFASADIFCFPTFYYAESFGLVVVEAMAFGLPVVTTRWRSIPELLPENYPGLVDIKSPPQIAAMLVRFATATGDLPEQLRGIFQKRFTFEQHLANLAAAIRSVASDVAEK
jgi:glycosyltransferase involved in cell wall biosynthesis